SGCCGMAGSFGFERDHYEVSQAVGERRLLPAVRTAAKHALIVADGFSCREQIAQATDRRALHLADVLALARQAQHRVPLEYPEAAQVVDHSNERVRLPAAAIWTALAGYAVLLGAYAGIFGTLFSTLWPRRDGVEPVRVRDVLLLGVATHKIGRIVTKDWVTSPVRAPFTEYQKSIGGGEVAERSR